MTDPTTSAAWIVKGEQELGPQRRCAECREWYPLDATFWIAQVYATKKKGRRRVWMQPCRACAQPARAAYTARWRRRRAEARAA